MEEVERVSCNNPYLKRWKRKQRQSQNLTKRVRLRRRNRLRVKYPNHLKEERKLNLFLRICSCKIMKITQQVRQRTDIPFIFSHSQLNMIINKERMLKARNTQSLKINYQSKEVEVRKLKIFLINPLLKP